MHFLKENFKQKATELFINDDVYSDILHNIQGDCESGIPFNDVFEHTIAYLSHSFHNIADKEFNLNDFKGILDTFNVKYNLGYKPNILNAYNGECEVRPNKFFKEAYCIFQLGYYFKKVDFTTTDFYKYTDHYFKTGLTLPIEKYTDDVSYLMKTYKRISEEKNHVPNIQIKKGFIGALFLMLNELELPTIHFKNKVSNCREYNALTKSPRAYRKYFPFELIEFDIKSAFPTFIDEEIDTNIGSIVYDLISDAHNVSRDEAKVLFNKWLNSYKYKTKEQTHSFFYPIYKEKTDSLIDVIYNDENPFWKVASYWEMIAIETFCRINEVKKYTRLHDAVFVVNNEYNAKIRQTDFSFVRFGAKKFYNYAPIGIATQNRIALKYVSAIPFELRKNTVFEYNQTEGIESKTFNGFKIFNEPFYYLNANFNVGANGYIKNGEFVFYDEEHFRGKLQNMVNVIAMLNDYDIRQVKFIVRCILNNILQQGILTYDTDNLCDELVMRIEVSNWSTKNHLFLGGNDLTINQYQSQYFSALKLYDLTTYAGAIIHIVKRSYKERTKLFIDVRELGIEKKKTKGNEFILDLISKFNTANGFENDIRSAEKIKEINTRVHEKGHTINVTYNSVATFVHNTNKTEASQCIGVNRRTYDKFVKWTNHTQDIDTITDIYFTLLDLIANAQTDYKIVSINGRNIVERKEKEQNNTNFKTYEETVTSFKDIFPNDEEHQEQMKKSVLQLDEREAIELPFYKEWQTYQYYNRDVG
jgi:hypothetical protein